MWPDEIEDWILQLQYATPKFLGEDHRRVREMLQEYPPLYDSRVPGKPKWDHASDIAHDAAHQVRERARDFYGRETPAGPDCPHYILNVYQFRMWFRNMTYREALRHVLDPEVIRDTLAGMPTWQSQLLYWRYLDRWTDEEIAKHFRHSLPGGRLVMPEEAREFSTEAYRELCRRLRQRVPIDRRNFTTFFPIFFGGRP